jgi:hypothetical protein
MRALKTAMYLLGSAVAVIYVLNPGAGIFELLPDALPIVGNLDEAAMVTLLLGCMRGLRRLRDEKKLAPAPAQASS